MKFQHWAVGLLFSIVPIHSYAKGHGDDHSEGRGERHGDDHSEGRRERHGDDHDNNPGHGGMPPGQVRRHRVVYVPAPAPVVRVVTPAPVVHVFVPPPPPSVTVTVPHPVIIVH